MAQVPGAGAAPAFGPPRSCRCRSRSGGSSSRPWPREICGLVTGFPGRQRSRPSSAPARPKCGPGSTRSSAWASSRSCAAATAACASRSPSPTCCSGPCTTGCQSADLSGVTLADLAEARRETETACARAASRRRTEDDLRALRETLERSADEQLEISEWLGLDIVFHRGVAEASHNPILAMPLTAVHAVAQPRLNRLIADQLDRAKVHAQHTAIYQAIADRKPQAAARAVKDHVAYLEVRYARVGVGPATEPFRT